MTIFSVELHFGKNKDMRKIGQIDIKKAKSIYLEEVAASGLLSKEELNRLWVVCSFDCQTICLFLCYRRLDLEVIIQKILLHI